jgi:hypothetical protein
MSEMPLYDVDGTALWPELMERLDSAPRRGTLIVMRDKPDRKRKSYLPWKEDYFRHRVSLRHGGNTEGADAGLSDAQLRALSGHKMIAVGFAVRLQTAKPPVMSRTVIQED